MAALGSFKSVCSPLPMLLLLLLLLLQDPVEPSQPQIIGPQDRIVAGSWASFQCLAKNFSSKAIKVFWKKDGKTIHSEKAKFFSSEGPRGRVYRVASSLAILLEQGDLRSQLSCQIQHNSSRKAQTNFLLGDVLRDSQQQSTIVLCIGLFLSKVAAVFIFYLFLINMWRRHRTRSHSGTSQEVRQSGTSS
ncbi:uncharacterized protein LOC113452832 isoform X1 [Pseudonaja textilis]|uniref:uncharacterized protein LOC113452832 isoform X1 n=1 Tax=Pseudonaja textilis TaxID=8673 RepID=UPI000EA87277|nr:uncharacterized protein LOC113452832 isoform X1 [Pseudonaja textilis]